MKKTIMSLSILLALLMSLFQPSVAPEEGEGNISTYDYFEDDYKHV